MNKLELLKKLKEEVEDLTIEACDWDIDTYYYKLNGLVYDYMNDTQDWGFEYIFENIIDYDTAEELARAELDRGGLVRLYYFMGSANFNYELFRIDGYGNLCEVYSYDIDNLKTDILDEIESKLEDINEGEDNE